MGEHFSLDIGRLLSSGPSQQQQLLRLQKDSAARLGCHCEAHEAASDASVSISAGLAEDSSVSECRICQEEEDIAKLDNPCACDGSLKYAHRKCVQRWCDEKGDTVCEICQQPYKGGYTAPPVQTHSEGIPIDISDEWGIPGAPPMVIHNPRILALAAAQRQFLQSEYEEYDAANFGSAACCRSAALILMALLLLRHALAMAATSNDEDAPMLFLIFLIRIMGFFLPCYIMARAMNMLQQRRQHQAAALTAAEMSALLQAGHPRGIRVSLAPVVSDLVEV